MNPRNNVTLSGVIIGKVRQLRKNGREFGCVFSLAVRQEYRNRSGEYGQDLIPIRFIYGSDAIRSFGLKLAAGDGLTVGGCVRFGPFDSSESLFHIAAEALSLDDASLARKYKKPKDECALPY